MGSWLSDTDASIVAGFLALAMLATWFAAWRRGCYLTTHGIELSPSKFADAILAVMGLLLAFTFSMSLAKHENRRQLAVVDSNAIGDFHGCVRLLDEPVQGELRAMLVQYVDQRLSLTQLSTRDRAALEGQLREFRSMHQRMRSLVTQSLKSGIAFAAPLVNSLNALFSSHASRVAAFRDRLPPSIILLLSIAVLVAVAQVGLVEGASKTMRPVTTLSFVLLIAMLIWVILDLNQPQQGWIRVSQEPLQRLLEVIKESSP